MRLDRREGVELSRYLPLDALTDEPIELDIEASESERAALAERFGLVALSRLSAALVVRRHGVRIELDGTLDAEVTQRCGVTLAPVTAALREPIRQIYTTEPAAEPHGEVVLDLDEDLPEPLDDEGVDLGEAVAQQLAMSLDPYLRAPGVSYPGGAKPRAGPSESEKDSPFAILASLKRAH